MIVVFFRHQWADWDVRAVAGRSKCWERHLLTGMGVHVEGPIFDSFRHQCKVENAEHNRPGVCILVLANFGSSVIMADYHTCMIDKQMIPVCSVLLAMLQCGEIGQKLQAGHRAE